MLRHYKRDSNHGALFARQNKPRVPNWNLILTRPASGAKRCSTTRDNIAKVAPHSCRFGAGYKSNRRPQGGQRVVRESHRGAYDRETIDKILDEGYVCHVGFAINGQPYVIPTLFARIGDAIYFHGSAASRMLRNASDGISVCITVTLTDGFVLARSVFNHSMNYRSVVALGKAALVDAPEEKLEALRAFTERIISGRWNDARQPNEKELKATSILRLPLTEVSAKIRSGPVEDDAPDYALPVWAGVIPLSLTPGAPIRDEKCDPSIPTPAYAAHYKR